MYCIDDHSAASINDIIAMKFHISVHVIYPQLCINVGTIGYLVYRSPLMMHSLNLVQKTKTCMLSHFRILNLTQL